MFLLTSAINRVYIIVPKCNSYSLINVFINTTIISLFTTTFFAFSNNSSRADDERIDLPSESSRSLVNASKRQGAVKAMSAKFNETIDLGADIMNKTKAESEAYITNGKRITKKNVSLSFDMTQNNYIFSSKGGTALLTDNQISLKMLRRDDLMDYGIFYRLNTNTSAANNGYIKLGQQVMFFAGNKYGKLEVGNYVGVSSLFAAYNNRYDLISDANNYLQQHDLPIIHIPQLLLDRGLWSEQKGFGMARINANKLNYITPLIEGLRFGISLIPSSYEMKFANKTPFIPQVVPINKYDAAIAYNDMFQVGCQYAKSISNSLGIKASLTGEHGRPRNQDIRENKASFQPILGMPEIRVSSLRSWEAAISATYHGWIMSGSYTRSSFGLIKDKVDTSYSFQLIYHIGGIAVTV